MPVQLLQALLQLQGELLHLHLTQPQEERLPPAQIPGEPLAKLPAALHLTGPPGAQLLHHPAHRQSEIRPELFVALLDGGDGLPLGVQLSQVLLAFGANICKNVNA